MGVTPHVRRLAPVATVVLVAVVAAACSSATTTGTATTGTSGHHNVAPGCPASDVAGGPTGCYLVPPGIHKIKHVIIIMQENRSFDSYFGTYPGADGIPMSNGVPSVCVPDPLTHKCDKPFHDVLKALDWAIRFTPKGMRRTFNDLARQARVHDITLRAISGHQTEQMQRHYSTAQHDEMRAAVGKVISIATARQLRRGRSRKRL